MSQSDRLLGYGWIGPRPVFVVDLSGSMAGLKLASLIDNFVQLLRPGGQMQRQCEAFGILAAMGGAVKCFPTTISRPLGACLLPTSAAAAPKKQFLYVGQRTDALICRSTAKLRGSIVKILQAHTGPSYLASEARAR